MEPIVLKLLTAYDISSDVSTTLIRETDYNAVYKIVDQSKTYVLRVSKQILKHDLAFEVETLNFLGGECFPSPEVFLTRRGDQYSEHETLYGTLFSFIDGTHVQIDQDHLPSNEQTTHAGRILGTMHTLTQDYRPTTSRSRTIFSELERAVAVSDQLQSTYEDANEFLDAVTSMIAFGKQSQRLTGLVHNDYRAHNIFFKGTTISGVIDFDWSCIGSVIKDVAHGALEWSFPDGRDEPDFELFQAFLDGYNQTAPEKIDRDTELYKWVMFASLADTATYLIDRLSPIANEKGRIRSYMYKKFRYFRNLVES